MLPPIIKMEAGPVSRQYSRKGGARERERGDRLEEGILVMRAQTFGNKRDPGGQFSGRPTERLNTRERMLKSPTIKFSCLS